MVSNPQDIQDLKAGGRHLVKILAALAAIVKPGVNLLKLEELASQLAAKTGGTPSFKGYHGYPATLCLSVNQTVVHGIPVDRVLQEGDIVAIDMGLKFKGWHTDAAISLPVGEVAPETKRLLAGTYAALLAGTDAMRVGNRIGDISSAIERVLRERNLTIFRSLVGHGVGRELHEEPMVPNFDSGDPGPVIQAGKTLALEPIAGLGEEAIRELPDGWTIEAADGKPAAHFEHTILATPDGPEVITPLDELVGFLENA